MTAEIRQVLFDIAPEMESLNQDKVDRLISYAIPQVGFGDGIIRQLATAYLTAHQYTLSTTRGAAGNITSEREGDLQRSFGGSSSGMQLQTTSYGQEYLRLRDKYIIKPINRRLKADLSLAGRVAVNGEKI